MDRISSAPNDKNAAWILQQNHEEGIAELEQLLFTTTLELRQERANAELQLRQERANAEMQRQLQEATVLRLQELLAVALRERDEAREQLLKLNHRLSEYAMLTNTQQHVMSRDRSEWLSAAETDEPNPSTTTTTSATAAVMYSNSSQLVGLADQFHWPSDGHHFDSANLELRPNVDLHQPPTSSSKVHHPNFIELQEQEQPFYHHNDLQQSFVERQETEQQHQVESHLIQDISTDFDLWQQQQEAAAAAGMRQPSNLNRGIAESSAGGHVTYPNPKSGLAHVSPSIICSTTAAMPAHLPEPPESDLRVMLSTLPERGKLLKAVMEAGPLLHTLLLAGPLPQWRYPPPTLDTVEIPRISMCPSSNSLPLGPMAHHVPHSYSLAAAMDPLQMNTPVSPPLLLPSPPRRINEPPPNAAFTTSLQSGSAAESSSTKLLYNPVLKSRTLPSQQTLL